MAGRATTRWPTISVVDAVADRGDHAGDLGAGRVGQRGRELVATLDDEAVDEVDPGRLDIDHDLIGARGEIRRLDDDQVVERTEGVGHELAHGGDPNEAA